MGNTVIQLRNDSAANWTSNNPVLALGEMGIETDTNRIKFGDGSTSWNSLAYFGGSSFKYGLYTLTADQTSNLTVGNHIEFNNTQGSIGGLSTGSGQAKGIITLPVNKQYKLTFMVSLALGSSANYATVGIYNRTSGNSIGLNAGIVGGGFPTNPPNTEGFAIISVGDTSIDIDLRLLAVLGSVTAIYDTQTYLLIEEYGGY